MDECTFDALRFFLKVTDHNNKQGPQTKVSNKQIIRALSYCL